MPLISKSDSQLGSKIKRLKEVLFEADAILIGAGSGLSTSAGFSYSGERFNRYFADFSKKYRFFDMYSGGFYPYSSLEEFWAYWSRYIYINRYVNASKDVYQKLLRLVKDKNYFVITTNVDHQFQKAGFKKERLFYTQGDYGLFQCSFPCHQKTYDNEGAIRKMVLSQGFSISENGELFLEEGVKPKRVIPTSMIPHCPRCGRPMMMNLRMDDTFVEDEGWKKSYERYRRFLDDHKDKRIVFFELGVGLNTPVIIKYPFWRWTEKNDNATYVCLNNENADCPSNIKNRSICINDDIGRILLRL